MLPETAAHFTLTGATEDTEHETEVGIVAQLLERQKKMIHMPAPAHYAGS